MLTDNVTNSHSAITEVLDELKKKEYRLAFRREATCLYCDELHLEITPDNFNVDESFYFGEIDNPDEDRTLYAISLTQGAKGFLIDSCNVYTDNISPEMMQKLK